MGSPHMWHGLAWCLSHLVTALRLEPFDLRTLAATAHHAPALAGASGSAASRATTAGIGSPGSPSVQPSHSVT